MRPSSSASARDRWRRARHGRNDGDERGSGVLATCFGIVFFLGFLLLAAQVTVLLHARSVVAAAAFDAARTVGSAAGGDGELDGDDLAVASRRAEQRVAALLGQDASLRIVRVDTAAIEVEVSHPAPRLLFGGGGLGPDEISRRATSRVEVLR